MTWQRVAEASSGGVAVTPFGVIGWGRWSLPAVVGAIAGSVTSRDTFRQVAGGASVVASRGPACLRWCWCCQVIGDTFG
jgi:hypothetical protein